MKWSRFSGALLCVGVLALCRPALAAAEGRSGEGTPPACACVAEPCEAPAALCDSLPVRDHPAGSIAREGTSACGERRLDRRVHRDREGWERIVPTHFKAQFAGGMGMVSIGFGWDYGRRCRWETDVLFGYLPRGHNDNDQVTFTLKQNYLPWSIACGNRFAVEPFYCGLYLNTIFGEDYWVREPDRYPKGYYTFSTKIRSHIFIGQRIVWNVNGKGWIKQLSAYYEVSTCDLYLISAVTNRYLTPGDIIGLSFGVKLQIF